MHKKGTTLVSLVILALFFSGICFADEPTAGMAIFDRSSAVTNFLRDEKVRAAIAKLEGSGYRQLSVEAIPIESGYSEEGLLTTYLVTSWHGKSEDSGYGWNSRFVTATVLDASLSVGEVICNILDTKRMKTLSALALP